jgi:hypothetical protein
VSRVAGSRSPDLGRWGMSRGWQVVATVSAVAVFLAVLADPTPDALPLLGELPGVLAAAAWAALAFGWVWMVAGVSRSLCWLRGEAACRVPRDRRTGDG